MSWQDRVAYELVKPRSAPWMRPILWAISAVFVVWGFAVCIITTLAVIAAAIDH
jgi:hypothetical protein